MLRLCVVGYLKALPPNKQLKANASLMLVHRLRQWANNNPTLGRRLGFTVIAGPTLT